MTHSIFHTTPWTIVRDEATRALSQLLSAVRAVLSGTNATINVDRVIAAVCVCANMAQPTDTAGAIEAILRQENMSEEDINSIEHPIISRVLQYQLRLNP